MEKNITLTTEEIELIYSALLVYGDKLCEANRLCLDDETENRIAQRSKKAYNTATKIVETTERNGIESDEIVNRIKAYNS